MPQLQFRGITKESIKKISKNLVDELQNSLECPRDYFTLELINTTYISEGEEASGYPLVEVKWFDRGQKVQDKVAKIITENLQNAGYKDVDIYFTILKKDSYYENGEHF